MTDLDWLLSACALVLAIVAVYQWARARLWKAAAMRFSQAAMAQRNAREVNRERQTL